MKFLSDIEIEERVINKIRERRDAGLKKYGIGMERDDLSILEWITHAQEEALDFSIYLEKLKQMFGSITGETVGLYQRHKEKTIMKTIEEINKELLTSIEDEYSDMVRRLKKDPSLIEKSDYVSDIHHMKDGLVGEVGELVDCLKKHLVYGKDLDYKNLVEELGDIEFYLEGIRQIFALDRKAILSLNIKKLTQRFHTGTYSDQQAQERADKCCGKCQNQ